MLVRWVVFTFALAGLTGCSLLQPKYYEFTYLQCAADMGVSGALRVVGFEVGHPVLLGAYVDEQTQTDILACYAAALAEGDD